MYVNDLNKDYRKESIFKSAQRGLKNKIGAFTIILLFCSCHCCRIHK